MESSKTELKDRELGDDEKTIVVVPARMETLISHELRPFTRSKLTTDWLDHLEKLEAKQALNEITFPHFLEGEEIKLLAKDAWKELYEKPNCRVFFGTDIAKANGIDARIYNPASNFEKEADQVYGELRKHSIGRIATGISRACIMLITLKTDWSQPEYRDCGYSHINGAVLEVLDQDKFIANFPYTAKFLFDLSVDSIMTQKKRGYILPSDEKEYYDKFHYEFNAKGAEEHNFGGTEAYSFDEQIQFLKRYQATEVDYVDADLQQ